MNAKVAVLRTLPETVIDDYGTLLRMADYTDHLAKEKPTHVKINISWDVWYPSCSTTPWQLEGVLKALVEDGYDKDSIMLTQNRTAVVDDRIGEVNNGLASVADRLGLGFTRLYEEPVEWIRFEPTGEMLVLDKLFEDEGILIPDIFPDSNMVQMPTVKTHVLTGTTGAMKNAFGGLVHDHRDSTHNVIHETLVDLLTIQQEIHSGLFAVMDGTICGDGPGPRALMPFEKDYILASADQVAIDAVAAKMMGFDPMDIAYIRLAHERGLGCGDIEQIEISGEDISEVDFHFHYQADSLASRMQKAAYRETPGLPGQAPLPGTTGPWLHTAANLYQDFYWYPYVGWPRLSRMAESKWGQMLQGYLPDGSELERQGRGKLPFAAVAGVAAIMGMSAFRRVAGLARRS